MSRLYSHSHAERLMAPTVLDEIPHPEANPTLTYRYQAAAARAWWGFIIHAYRTGNHREAWNMYCAEIDSININRCGAQYSDWPLYCILNAEHGGWHTGTLSNADAELIGETAHTTFRW